MARMTSPWPKTCYVVGVDLGQSVDPTAIAIIEKTIEPAGDDWSTLREVETAARYIVKHLERLPLGTSYPMQVHHVASLLARPPLSQRHHKKTELVIDRTGVGRPVFDLFKAGGLKPIGVTITAGDSESREASDDYRVSKQMLVSRLQAEFHEENLKIVPSLPDAPVLAKELQEFRATYTSAGNVLFAAREGAHDDLVLATAIGLWWAHRGGGPKTRVREMNW